VAHVCTAMITTPTAYPLSGAVEPGTNIVHPFFS
jgi:hypothetical protein